jgi:hypothetical protein
MSTSLICRGVLRTALTAVVLALPVAAWCAAWATEGWQQGRAARRRHCARMLHLRAGLRRRVRFFLAKAWLHGHELIVGGRH